MSYQHQAWNWLKSELVRLLGEEGAAQLWAEHARLARIDRAEASVARQRGKVDYHSQVLRLGIGERSCHEPRLQDAQARLCRAEAKARRVREEARG